jgi:hypothetical protein
MSRPFSPDTPETRISGLRRDTESVKRRSAAPWRNVGDPGEPAFENGWGNATATTLIPNPVPMRFRVALGGGIDIEGDVMGGADGTVVFTLPAGYRPDKDKPLHAHDDDKNYVAGRVFSDGTVVLGTP